MFWILLCLAISCQLCSAKPMEPEVEKAFILVPHGIKPQDEQRVIIPAAKEIQPPFPCIVADSGTYEHGQTFTKGSFHYRCSNGTSEVIACVAHDKSVIQTGRTFIQDGIRHKCIVHGDTVTYERESTCYEHGIQYAVGEYFRNGSFKLVCQENGISIDGCYIQNSDESMPLGSIKIIGHYRHNCESLAPGRVRYTITLVGCKKDDQYFNEGQVWTEKHIRYQCTADGTLRVLGCVDEGGLYVELGRDVLMSGVVHRCYRVEKTTFYHRFRCNAHTLAECIAAAPATQSHRMPSAN